MKNLAEGYLETNDGHNVYYKHVGNAAGPTLFFVHGGPGLGTSSFDEDFFDLDKVNVIRFDQRGSGKSTPTAQLEGNTTQNLVKDMLGIMDLCKVDKTILFGGSWGSTLSLMFAITYPERVQAMILRGIFTGSKSERAHFEKGGTQLFYPSAWKRVTLPLDASESIAQYYFDRILNGDADTCKNAAYDLCYYSAAVSRLKPMTDAEIEGLLASYDFETHAKIQCHFASNDFFLTPGYIMENLPRIHHIPMRIVQGRYDMITPPKMAMELSEKLNVKLDMVECGHSSRESPLREALIENTKDFLASL
ncbi:MAG: alpha/beta hydrolase [Flavobacteriales bacterium]|nr:alpha/beta hydrolase [Flavobacteriales bacterium]